MWRRELWGVYQFGGGWEAEEFGLCLIGRGEPLSTGCTL